MTEEKITIGTKYPLDGLLTIPSNVEAPYPAVVLVHGSGPNDMNEKIGNTYFFKDMAEGLGAHGIVTIRYNKRTHTHGKELVKNYGSELTVKEETIEDALFAADLLRHDSRINPEKIFIAGHSMGGMLAPRIDAEGGNFAGLIILAGSPRKIEEIIIEQQDNFLKKSNAVIRWITSRPMLKLRKKLNNLYNMTDEEAKRTSFIGKHNKMYYLLEWGLKPAGNFLKQLTKPILVMHGTDDVHASVENDFNKYKEILARHPNVCFKLYPGLNHLFMPAIYGGDIRKVMKEYKKAQNIEKSVIDDIANWVKQQ